MTRQNEINLPPLEKTLDEIADAEKVRRAQQTVSEPRLIGDHHYDRLPPAIKKWRGAWYADKPGGKFEWP